MSNPGQAYRSGPAFAVSTGSCPVTRRHTNQKRSKPVAGGRAGPTRRPPQPLPPSPGPEPKPLKHLPSDGGEGGVVQDGLSRLRRRGGSATPGGWLSLVGGVPWHSPVRRAHPHPVGGRGPQQWEALGGWRPLRHGGRGAGSGSAGAGGGPAGAGGGPVQGKRLLRGLGRPQAAPGVGVVAGRHPPEGEGAVPCAREEGGAAPGSWWGDPPDSPSCAVTRCSIDEPSAKYSTQASA